MIRIASYDDGWPSLFDAEAGRIRKVLGDLALRIEHVGSTAVPGLAAKPVIDIQISVASLAQPGRYSAPLAELGYRYIPLGDFDRVYPFFQKPAEWPSTHHVHLCIAGSEQERRHLAFRDYLRGHAEIASEYVELKQALAAANDGETLESREKYSLAKAAFVNSVLERAFSNG